MIRITIFTLLLMLAGTPCVSAKPDAPAMVPVEAEHLTQLLRGLLLANIPTPMAETAHDWGKQRDVLVGMKWHKLKPEPNRAMRNDGHWQKVRIEAINPNETLALGIRNITSPEPGKTTFEAFIGMNVRMFYDQQLWKSGVRIYSGETRARCWVALRVICELTSRLEKQPGQILPVAVLRVRVTEADLHYTNLVVEHTAGLDGIAAKAVGDMLHKFISKVKPHLERDLLDKANAAIIKSADTKEIRVELDKLLRGKIPVVKKPE